MSRTGARLDPIGTFRFTVKFDELAPCGFTDCTGLASETEVQEYSEGGLNTHTWRFPGRSKQGNVTLRGRTRSDKAKDRAAKVASKVKGVKKVTNELIIDPNAP